MAAPIDVNSQFGKNFFVLDSLEKQTFYMLCLMSSMENVYNSANPNNLLNRATVVVNFDQKTATGQLTCSLSDSAIEGRLVDGVLPFLSGT